MACRAHPYSAARGSREGHLEPWLGRPPNTLRSRPRGGAERCREIHRRGEERGKQERDISISTQIPPTSSYLISCPPPPPIHSTVLFFFPFRYTALHLFSLCMTLSKLKINPICTCICMYMFIQLMCAVWIREGYFPWTLQGQCHPFPIGIAASCSIIISTLVTATVSLCYCVQRLSHHKLYMETPFIEKKQLLSLIIFPPLRLSCHCIPALNLAVYKMCIDSGQPFWSTWEVVWSWNNISVCHCTCNNGLFRMRYDIMLGFYLIY